MVHRLQPTERPNPCKQTFMKFLQSLPKAMQRTIMESVDRSESNSWTFWQAAWNWRHPVVHPPSPDEAIGAYWDTAYAEGREGRKHDTEEGVAQQALHSLKKAINATVQDAVMVERERCARACMAAVQARTGSATMREVAEWRASEIRRGR